MSWFYKILLGMCLFAPICLLHAQVERSYTLENLASGAPSHWSLLGEQSFVPLTLHRAEGSEVLYLNTDLLNEMGVDTLHTPLAQLKAQALSAFAWISPTTLPQNSEALTAYADYYGGSGIGSHKGSARAAILGQVQIKGVGRTPMFDGGLKDGTVGLHEGIKEVIWGEFLHRLLPYGANRVIALIGVPTSNTETHEPRVLIVRQDPLRAGHFVTRELFSDEADLRRAQHNQRQLPAVLTRTENRKAQLLISIQQAYSAPENALWLAVDEWLYRVSQQLAKAHMQRVYHGAVSESNININGQFIDYGTSTTNSGFGPIRFLMHEEPFGRYNNIQKLWGPGLARRLLAPISATPYNIKSILNDVFLQYFHTALRKETLLLLGVPHANIQEALKDTHLNSLAQSLFATIVADNLSIKKAIDIQDHPMPHNTSHFDFSELLLTLVNSINDPRGLNLDTVPIGPESRSALRAHWQFAAPKLLGLLSSFPHPQNYLRHQIRWMNRSRPELYRDRLRASTHALGVLNTPRTTTPFDQVTQTITHILNQTEPQWKNLDLHRFVPIRFNDNTITLYDAHTDQIRQVSHQQQTLSWDISPPLAARPIGGWMCKSLLGATP